MPSDDVESVPLGSRRALFVAWVAAWSTPPGAILWMTTHGLVANHTAVTALILTGPPTFAGLMTAATIHGVQDGFFDNLAPALTLAYSVPYFATLWSPLGHYFGVWSARTNRYSTGALWLLALFVGLHLTFGFAFSLTARE